MTRKSPYLRWIPSEVDEWIVKQMERDDEHRRNEYSEDVENEIAFQTDRRIQAYSDIARRNIADEIGKLRTQRTKHLKVPLDVTQTTPCKICKRFHGPLTGSKGHS